MNNNEEEKTISKPNIFSFATSELSQDAFLAWLIQWAEFKYQKYNPNLNLVARDFIRYCTGKNHHDFTKIEVGRQWEGIDVWAMIDEQFFIVIEDKVNTSEHSNQLERYKQKVEHWYEGKGIELKFIYLKTGNEPLKKLQEINDKGYKTLIRSQLIEILSKYPVQDDTFNAFLEHILSIETRTNSYIQFESIISDWQASEGFYLALEEKLPASGWGQVNNQSGAFLGFWYHWMGNKLFNEIYIQIENHFSKGIKVVIKVNDSNISKEKLYQALHDLTTLAKDEYQLDLSKPARFSTGKKTATLAIVSDMFPNNKQDDFDIDVFVIKLRKLEELINEYCSNT